MRSLIALCFPYDPIWRYPTSVSDKQSLEASGSREIRRNRKRILFGLLAAVVVAVLVVAITATKDSSGRAGTIVNGCELNPSGTALVNCRGVDLHGQDLTKANTIGADFSCSTQCSNLSGAIFNGTDLTRANLTGANLNGAKLRNTTLSVNFVCDTDTTTCKYNGTIFTNADLTNADLTGASYDSSAGKWETVFTGVTWKNTICSGGGNSDSFTPKTCLNH